MSVLPDILLFSSSGAVNQKDFLFFSKSRNEISSRLGSWAKLFHSHKFNQEKSFLIASICGELGNNSFDHNLGKWDGLPGCLIGFDFSPAFLRIFVVDRGQGIVESLKNSLPKSMSETDVLRAAFEQIVSGRAPEQRGNGLKYVRKNFEKNGGRGLVCYSGKQVYTLGDSQELQKILLECRKYNGTVVGIDWNYDAKQ